MNQKFFFLLRTTAIVTRGSSVFQITCENFYSKGMLSGFLADFFFQRCTSFVVLTATRQNIRIEMYGGVAPSDFSCVEAGGSINSSLPKYSRFTKSFQAFFPSLVALETAR